MWMLLASISAMSACACLPWQICRWDLKFTSNFSRPKARTQFEFLGLFAIELCIYMESIFCGIRNTQLILLTDSATERASPTRCSRLLPSTKTVVS